MLLTAFINILARVVAKDTRSTTDKNIRLLEKETGGLTWAASAKKIKGCLGQQREECNAWRIPYLGKLIEERDRLVYMGEDESQEVARVQGLMESLCTN